MLTISQLGLMASLAAGLANPIAFRFHGSSGLHGLFSLAIGAGNSTVAQPTEHESSSAAPKYPNPETELLEIYVGAWSVTERHFDARGEEIGVVKGGEDIVWVLDRHAIGRTYTTTRGDELYRASATIKWIPGEKLYRGVWFDSSPASGPTSVTAEWNAAEKTMLWKMEVHPPGGTKEEYKIIEKFFDGDRREAVTYRVEKSGVTKSFVVQYKRTVPCPGKIRTLFGD